MRLQHKTVVRIDPQFEYISSTRYYWRLSTVCSFTNLHIPWCAEFSSCKSTSTLWSCVILHWYDYWLLLRYCSIRSACRFFRPFGLKHSSCFPIPIPIVSVFGFVRKPALFCQKPYLTQFWAPWCVTLKHLLVVSARFLMEKISTHISRSEKTLLERGDWKNLDKERYTPGSNTRCIRQNVGYWIQVSWIQAKTHTWTLE